MSVIHVGPSTGFVKPV